MIKGMVIQTVPFLIRSISMNEFPVLNFDVENCIIQHIAALFAKHDVEIASKDVPMRDDVFDILDQFCKVVYYPLHNEGNNGFHIKDMPFANGTTQDFVFINTSQTIEKQVFTAAHELGHIWEIDDYVLKEINLQEISDIREKIINRFAATLLMPDRLFKKILIKEIEKVRNNEGEITSIDLIKLIVSLMNYFLVPKKAVVLRLVELDFVNEEGAKFLIEDERVEALIQKYIQDLGYCNLRLRTEKKWIEGLSDLLDVAETSGAIPQKKIDYLRKKFDFGEKVQLTSELTDILSLNTFERSDT